MVYKDQKNKAFTSRKTILSNLFKILFVALVLLLTAYSFPYIMKLSQQEVRERVRDYVTDKGAVGILFMLGIQLLQVVLSVIPGEPVEVLFGFIFGPWMGALLCMLGIFIGSMLVFCFTRALGKDFMKRVESEGKYDKLRFLKDPTKRDAFIFILFFIPGTPKDTLTYFAPFTKIGMWKFLVLSTFARIPSIITSTFAGDSIFTGDYLLSAVIFGITGAVGICGILIYNYIVKKHGDNDKHEG